VANPVIERELVGALRGRGALAVQLLPAAACALLVLLRWPSGAQADLGGERSREVFQLFAYGLLAAVALLVPAYPATAVVRERVAGTLALLLQSPLRPVSIYLGKLLGVLGFAALPLAASLPAAAACFALGGVGAGQLLALYGVLALAALQYSALGLFVSSVVQSSESALRVTYGLVFAFAVLALGPYQALQGNSWGILVTPAAWLRAVSPLPAVMEIVGQGGVGSAGLSDGGGAPKWFLVTSLVVTPLLMVATVLRLRPTLFDRARAAGVVTDERPARDRLWRRLLYVVDPARRSGLIGPFTNPVLVKELRSRQFGRSHWLVRLASACAAGSLGLALLSSSAALDWGTTSVSAIIVLLQGALVVLLTPGLAAGLISGELESGGWTLLRATPLSAGTILRGKLLSVAGTLLVVLLATLPGYGVMVYAKPAVAQQVAYAVASLALTAAAALTLSAAIGSLFRRTAAATVAAYAVVLIVGGGPLLVWLGRDTAFGHALVERVLTASPLAAALSALEVPGFGQYHIVPAAWWLSGGVALVCWVLLRLRVWQLMRPD
jgi:ABC-type transport system involved in multi-copper enzyme maturation permease subunit